MAVTERVETVGIVEEGDEVLTVLDDFIAKDEKTGKIRVRLDKLAEHIMEKYTFKTLRNSGEMLVYDAVCGVYRKKGETIVEEAIEEALMKQDAAEQATRYNVSEVIKHIQRRTYIDEKAVNANHNIINVRNGLLNLVKVLKGEPDALEPHTSRVLSTIQLPVKYDPKATSPRIDEFLREIVAEPDVPLLEEIVGWCLVPDYRFQRGVLFIGQGRNGKSTFLSVIEAFLGSENCSAVSLQALCNHRFASAELYGKLANLHADLSRATVADAGMFKQLTGGDLITAERKFGAPFTFVNFAKLIFSANNPPQIFDDTAAMWRRIMLIEFPNQFAGEKEVKGLIRKLATQSELSGLLNVALTGLLRLLRQQDFSYTRSDEETREDYIRLSNPLQAFVEECCIVGIPETLIEEPPAIPKEELYQNYLAYCRDNRLPAESKKGFGRHLKALCKRDIRERKAGWVGIALKEEAE